MTSNSALQDRSSPELKEDLASLIEQAIKAPAVISGLVRGAPQEPDAAPAVLVGSAGALPNRLIAELTAAQEQFRAEPPPAPEPPPAAPELEPPAAAAMPVPAAPVCAEAPLSGEELVSTLAAVFAADPPARPVRAAAPAAADLSAGPDGAGRSSCRPLAPGSGGMPGSLRVRCLALLSFVHWHVLDRRIESLLFFKTPAPGCWLKTGTRGQKEFNYRGPIPKRALGWALSALPADLRRYAFVDFEAGNGRTLLLAARRNFEHAIGYTHDGEACAVLEMNLAQCSRSRMSCRDVRALRGDRDGIPMPEQSAVLFFPDSLARANLDAVLSRLAELLKLNPRAVYLIFENSGPERGHEEMRLFRKVRLPLMSRIEAALFSPGQIAVYKSVQGGAAG